jgi:pyrophosphatase PpaX
MPIEAVIFDLDGTLAVFNLDYKGLRGEVRSYLMRITVPGSVLEVNESIFDMMQKTELYLKNNGKTAKTLKEARTQILAIAEKYEMEAATTTNLQSGAVETLKELKKMKLKVGLCTTSSEAATNYILKRFKIADYFQVVVPRDKVKRVKPNPEQFELALKKLEARSDTTLIVGDSMVDMESAKEIKAIAVGLPTGLSTTEQLTSHGANYIITSLNDLPTLIKNVNKN